MTFWQAKEITATGNIFTTHTPVPAGLERFGFDLIDEHFTDYYRELGLNRNQFIDLGREHMGDYELFSMPVLALKMSAKANGVAQLHGVVSRKLWQWMYPGVPEQEIPITSITNGVHVETWISNEMAELFDRYLNPRWRDDEWDAAVWQDVDTIPDTELWRTHERRRERLIAFTRAAPADAASAPGRAAARDRGADEVLDPDALTIGFARRFATYKRATLIMRDVERLKAILNNADRPVQIIFAGKAHPHDTGGKELIRQITNLARTRRIPPPDGLPRRLRHAGRALSGAGRRRVDEHAAPPERSQRHQRHEGHLQRRLELQHPRRLVGGRLRSVGRLGDWQRRGIPRIRMGSSGFRRKRGALQRPRTRHHPAVLRPLARQPAA